MNKKLCIETLRLAIRRFGGNLHLRISVPTVVILLSSCAPGSNFGEFFDDADLFPPVLSTAEQPDGRSIRFTFDEPVYPGPEPPQLDPEILVDKSVTSGNTLTILFAEDQEIGKSYVLRFSAQDESGNSLSGLYRFCGWNPRIPATLINELNPRGSSSTPDCVELLTLEEGNIGGIQLLIGTEGHFEHEMIFPGVEVEEGEYIVVHTKPEGLAEELDETDSMMESGGKLAIDTARDFWMKEAPGLPGNNGALSLMARPGGEILDAVLYSDRTDNPDDERLGWTADGFAFATELTESGSWIGQDGGTALPSDAVNVAVSTATRSICRSPDNPIDTNSKDDWHVVPTRGASFGRDNSTEVYSP